MPLLQAGDLRPGVDFAKAPRNFGAAVAVITEDGPSLSYSDLADRVDAFARRLGPEKRLLYVPRVPSAPSICKVLQTISSSACYIYISHGIIVFIVIIYLQGMPVPVAVAFACVLGILIGRVVMKLEKVVAKPSARLPGQI